MKWSWTERWIDLGLQFALILISGLCMYVGQPERSALCFIIAILLRILDRVENELARLESED